MSQSNFSETKYWLRTAHTISEALPYMQRYSGKRFVIKIFIEVIQFFLS